MIRSGAFTPGVSPATWLGVMGGGQLGRMFAQASQAMGFKVAVLEATAHCPASHAADRFICADYNDNAALGEMAKQCHAVTTEFENVPAEAMTALALNTFVAPSASCVAIAQDRMAEKQFFVQCAAASGILPAPHHFIGERSDLAGIADTLLPGLLKTVRLGYDGKGQVSVSSRSDLDRAFEHIGGAACVLEKLLPLVCEISVLVVRGADGQTQVYPIAENIHRNGILHTTLVPAMNVPPETAAKAQAAAVVFADKLDYVGVMCIEFFVLADGSLVVNEMAPRPHNSGHYTIDACITSQFAQQVRAMARLPLGDVRQHSPAAMLNLLGDLWFTPDLTEDAAVIAAPCEPPWEKVLGLPGACLHLYGKQEARPGRKMGHVTFVAPTLEAAVATLHVACEILGIEP